jgi:DNA-binding transcriptional MocR family regulator
VWTPRVDKREGPIYRAIVDALQEDVGQGHLKPGAQLPTQRALADALKITVSTVTRAYSEAKRIGLIDGEVGRGTYVRQSGLRAARKLKDPGSEVVDLMLNRPALAGLDTYLRDALGQMMREETLESALDYPPPGGFDRHRAAGADWVARAGVQTDPDGVIVCSGAQHALTVALASHASRGDLIATEQLNYPGIKRIADFLGVRLIGLRLDEQGMVPEALAEACKKHKVRGLICTPVNHNPTTASMSLERRKQILDIALGNGLTVIEDDVHGPLVGGKVPPLYALSGGATIYVSSLSKAVAPGLRIGFLVSSSPGTTHRFAELVHTTTWGAPPLIGDIILHWIESGVADRFIQHHRRSAEERVRLARDLLKGFEMRSSTSSYHVWLMLPAELQTEDFAISLRMRNVAATPGSWFSIDGSPVRAIRLSLGAAANLEQLAVGLKRIGEVLHGGASAPLI